MAAGIDRLVSMSDMKYDAMVRQSLQIGERVAIPGDRIPGDAKAEMAAKKAAGCFTLNVPCFTLNVPNVGGLVCAKDSRLGDYETS